MDMAASCMACPIRSSTWVFMGRFRDGSTVARLHAEIRINMLSTPTPGERREGWDIIRYSPRGESGHGLCLSHIKGTNDLTHTFSYPFRIYYFG